MINRRKFSTLMSLSTIGLTSAQAAEWPERPVTIVVPFAPGGATDVAARILAQELTQKFGQPFLVDNKAGAAGNIGLEAVIRSPANGYTLAFATMGSLTTNPHIYGNAKFNVERDLRPISQTFKVDHVLVVNPKVPAKDVAQLIAYAKANPDKLTYGSAGTGSSVQMFAILLEMRTGIKMRHIPYKGSAPALADLLSGNIDILMDSVPTSLSQIQAGKVRALAITSGVRNKRVPDVPTMQEAGIADYDTAAWGSLMAPTGTPDALIARLSEAVQEAYKKPSVIEKFLAQGMDPVASTPTQLSSLIQRDTELWGKVVSAGKVKID
ncbi:MAG: tripartite tricarboxylate transporter substrate binding protein [Betaproteobacteria bacterium]|jgi:tripartite-type tricarboxylate transporter receptor subunit TctC|nr:tripartite tricarboxylate transporter substrate binding protein [Betaproteobacteria bacterium]NBT67314.1 tripartite tricarboxylate transporter substrate binding protein [Betaproteobacteria bacterium]